jgi:hypothetical protein
VNIPPTEVVSPELMHINNLTSAHEFRTYVTDVVDLFSPSLLFPLLHFLLSLHLPPSAPSFPLPPFPSTSMAIYLSPFLPPPLLYPLAFWHYFNLCVSRTNFSGLFLCQTRKIRVPLPQNGVA